MTLPRRLAFDTARANPDAKLCAQCGQEFTRNRRKYSNAQWASQRFCSSRCASTIALSERLYSLCVPNAETGCWDWVGLTVKGGYGRLVVKIDGRRRHLAAHRAAFAEWVGEVPDDRMVLHGCDNARCINPAHLRLGTHRDNMDDKVKRQRARNQFGRPKKYAAA